MINKDKWIKTLPTATFNTDQKIDQLDHDRWESTLIKKNSFSSVKKYSLLTLTFIFGLLVVSVVKNQTRILEKEIESLNASLKSIEFNLAQSILDNEVITSPENISKLAEEYLNTDLRSYKKSQIKSLNNAQEENFISSKSKKKTAKNNEKKLSQEVKLRVSKKIENKKKEIKKLQELYNDPKSIPDEVKGKIAKKIKEKKFELKSLYESPKEVFTFERFGKWSIIQVAKLLIGMPVIPGR